MLLDVPTLDIWETIKKGFPNSSNGSRIIFSFQEADAARYPEIRFFGRELLRLKWEDTKIASTQSKKGGDNDIVNKTNPDWELKSRLEGAFKYLDKDDDNDIRFLMVLDNIYALNVWYNLETIVSKNTNTCSRVILITRDAYLARCFGLSVALFKLDLLKEGDDWTLFLKKAKKYKTKFLEENEDKSSEQDQKKLDEIKEMVWKKCRGLPLSICVLGGQLYSKKLNNISEWPQEIEKIMPGREEKKDPTLQDMDADHSISEDVLSSLGKLDPSQVWALGYKDLSPHLKECLHYSSLFPKSYEIPVRRILQLWIAEGLVEPSKGKEQTTPEDEVTKYFEELEARSMIEVAKRRLDGTPKTCRIPITLRDAFCPDAEEKGLFYIHRKSDSTSTSKNLNIRRLAEHFDIKINPPDEKIEYLRSFISFKTRKSDKPAKEVIDFLNKMISKRSWYGLLKVLDLEGVYC
ncbi:hypothetical protein Patl1_24354 [Pistacia atlantica]|uniref:Uncharacterized protein n=1 Tax=Pistacia atlantica TaxID=434234 RepID=A0ACC0ZY01_9ROSI|nr:hypothetical protein Patl1_24354 [Pistacia atlantica]